MAPPGEHTTRRPRRFRPPGPAGPRRTTRREEGTRPATPTRGPAPRAAPFPRPACSRAAGYRQRLWPHRANTQPDDRRAGREEEGTRLRTLTQPPRAAPPTALPFANTGGIDNVYDPAGRTHDPTTAARRSRSPGPGATKPLGPGQERDTREPARSSPAPCGRCPPTAPPTIPETGGGPCNVCAAAPATCARRPREPPALQPARGGPGNPGPATRRSPRGLRR